MAQTEIVNGLHLIKLHGFHTVVCSIPKPVAAAVEMRNGAYVAVRQIGRCVVIANIEDVTQTGAPPDFAKEFESAIRAWEKEKNNGR